MPQDLIKLVLDPGVTRHEFRRLASVLGWTVRGFGKDLPDEPFEEAWGTRGQRHEVHFVEDPFVGLSYLLLDSADREPVLDEVKDRLHVWSVEETIGSLRDAPSPQLRAERVRILALCAPSDQEEASVAAFGSAAQDPSEEVRESVVFAGAYLPGWSALREILGRMAASDASPAIRADAQAMLETLDTP
ncbi:MAG TPA: hypothetical protein VJT49_07240 [Amycolatopsis sp.]|uniref:hypothetical protein n=1 Tax=Amycolatopsis sp. TaxID=37632 RepID=UPI002B48528A|nr:hypothetical protein [Amycolatopsis sp.]HKS44901.1 hypothetical protein [Amycolatopsis sp.]